MRTRLLLTAALFCSPLMADDWPQWMGPKRDGVWRETGIIETLPAAGPKVRWRYSIGGGYAGPAVAGGRVYVLDRQEGGEKSGDAKPGTERLICLDVKTGEKRWIKEWRADYTIDYGSGPRATPTVFDGLVYALGSEGHLYCAAADSGEIRWSKEFKRDFGCAAPTWGFSGAPLIYEDLVICLASGKGTTCVAYDRKTGEEKWRAVESSQAGYVAPTLINNHGKPLLMIWHGEALVGLDPATGKVFWTMPWSIRFGVTVAGPIQVGNEVLITNFWTGARLLRLKEDQSLPEILWETEKASDRQTTHLNALMCTPIAHENYFYGVCSYGQFRCLEWKSGERKWETLSFTGGKEQRWGTAFLTRHENRWFIFNEQGELITAKLSPTGYQETSRVKVIEPNSKDVKERPVVWSHPAYADKACFVRNDTEIICLELGKSAYD